LPVSILCGALDHQIEHHLFPTIPAWRYPEMAREVRAIADKYGVPYTTGSFAKQFGSMVKQLARLSLPRNLAELRDWRQNARKMAREKREGMRVLKGERRLDEPRPAKTERTRKSRGPAGWLHRAA